MRVRPAHSFNSFPVRRPLSLCARGNWRPTLEVPNWYSVPLRLRTLALSSLLAFVLVPLALNRAEAAAFGEWKAMLSGTNGWHSFKKTTFPDKGWVFEPDGSLHHLPKGGGGDLISAGVTSNDFEFRWEWKVAPGGNSGVKYFVSEDRAEALGHEYQIVDDTSHPDALRGPKWQTASFYDVLPAITEKNLKPVGEWNKSRIVVRGNQVEHWLNGVKVIQYQLGSPEVTEAIATSKFKNVKNPPFGTKFQGHILLQDHGDEVWFSGLRIREILPRPPGAPANPRSPITPPAQGD